ncbi:MAG: nucleoside hydrolase [Candidatus Tectomicrobia bacterium]|nr:nucleoside hydrolase [Candidatus Tectomicrobia bacterium]
MPKRIIIDTDPGVDDALALLLAFRSPELKVEAITTVAGNVSVEIGTANAFTIVELLDLPPPPISKGYSRPLKRALFTAERVHSSDGLGGLRTLEDGGKKRYPLPSIRLFGRDAPETILRLVDQYPHEITLIPIGPLTNVATTLERDRKTMAKLKEIILMGGAFSVPGNVTPRAEFNIFVDPEAAQAVLNSGIPITIVGLDVTMRVRISSEALSGRVEQGGRVGQFVRDLTSVMSQRASGITLHDPLAVGVAIDRTFVKTEKVHVTVETEGKFTTGMTVADLRHDRLARGLPLNVEIALEVDSTRFLNFFLDRVVGGERTNG